MGHDYKIVINGKTFFGPTILAPSVGNGCAMAKAAPVTAMGAGRTVGVAAQVRQASGKRSTVEARRFPTNN